MGLGPALVCTVCVSLLWFYVLLREGTEHFVFEMGGGGGLGGFLFRPLAVAGKCERRGGRGHFGSIMVGRRSLGGVKLGLADDLPTRAEGFRNLDRLSSRLFGI